MQPLAADAQPKTTRGCLPADEVSVIERRSKERLTLRFLFA